MINLLKNFIRPILKKIGIYDFAYNRSFSLLNIWYKYTNIIKRKIYKTAVILTYHRIDDVLNDPHLLCVTPQNFEKHLQFLKANYEVVSLSELHSRLEKKQLTGREAAITLDDGYLDNYTNALPLLEKYNLPATIFITTGFLGEKANLDWDHEYRSEDKASFLNEDQIKKMSVHKLITVGAHTHRHNRLSGLDYQKQLDEINISKEILQNITGSQINYFAYPFGGIFDFNKDTTKVLKSVNLRCAYTTVPALLTYNSDKYRLPRINIRNYSIEVFLEKIYYHA